MSDSDGSNNDNNNDNDPRDEQEPSETSLTLEQAMLAPLDSILKAQLHSARSFLNLLLQLGYPHQSQGSDGTPYRLEFDFEQDGELQRVSVPALSLVPISPLAVDSARVQLEMSAKRVVRQSQIRDSETEKVKSDKNAGKTAYDRYNRPWFLVDKPVNIEGDIVAPQEGEAAKHSESRSAIKIDINVKSIPLPSGLDKLLSSLSNMSTASTVSPTNDSSTSTSQSSSQPPDGDQDDSTTNP